MHCTLCSYPQTAEFVSWTGPAILLEDTIVVLRDKTEVVKVGLVLYWCNGLTVVATFTKASVCF